MCAGYTAFQAANPDEARLGESLPFLQNFFALLAAAPPRRWFMSKELVIASNLHETKVAVLEEDQLVEVYFQRANEYSLAGSIHKGRVTRVLPGMQSAFVDLGLERDTFLYVSDFFEENEDFDPVTESEAKGGARPERFERSDRRDRGPRGPERQGDRLESRPIQIKVDAAAEVIEPPALPVESFSEGEPAPAAAVEASLESTPPPDAPANASEARPFSRIAESEAAIGGADRAAGACAAVDSRRTSTLNPDRNRRLPLRPSGKPWLRLRRRRTCLSCLVNRWPSTVWVALKRAAAHPAHAESTSAEGEYEQDAAALEALVDELESSEEEHLALTHGDRPQIHPEHETLEASVVPARTAGSPAARHRRGSAGSRRGSGTGRRQRRTRGRACFEAG